MSTWDEDYPDGYECCASGSCEVCCGAQGQVRSARAAAAGGDDDPSSPHSPARLSDPLRKYREPHAPRDNCGPACNHEGYEAAGGDQ